MVRTTRRGFTLLELVVAIVVLAVIVGVAVPTVAFAVEQAKVRAEVDSMANLVRYATNLTQLDQRQRMALSDFDTAAAETSFPAVGGGNAVHPEPVLSAMADKKPSLAYPALSVAIAKNAGAAMRTRFGGCVMARVVDLGTPEVWAYTQDQGHNCDGLVALGGEGQGEPGYRDGSGNGPTPPYVIGPPAVPRLPEGAPDGSTGVVGTPGDRQVVVSWLPPASDGGDYVTDYAVQYAPYPDGAWATFPDGVSAGTTATVTGLTNGSSYTFRVAAVNSIGTGEWSASAAAVVPRTVPGAPGTPTATAVGDTAVQVAFDAPASDGGAAVTGYRATCTSVPAGSTLTGTGAASPVLVLGVLGGRSYSCTAAAQNAAGWGAASGTSNAVSFESSLDVPGTPAALTATAGDRQVLLSWPPVAAAARRPVSGYRAYRGADLVCTQVAPSVECAVAGLANGTSYTFTVRAYNDAGESGSSPPATAVPSALPGAPTSVSASAADATAALSWLPPRDDGGAAVTGYALERAVAPWTTWEPVDATAETTATVAGLTNGTGYRFRVAAVNSSGQGPWSEPSPTATPRTVPGAPTQVAGAPADRGADLTWQAPAADGGAAVTGYQVQFSSDGGTTWTPSTGTATTSATVTGLTNGAGHVFRVAAVNEAGRGPWSTASAEVVPVAAPSAPGTPTAEAGDTRATVAWTAAGDDGGSPVVDHQLQWSDDSGTTWTTVTSGVSTATTATVTGLSNGTSYVFRVAAVNAAGRGAWSDTSDPVTPYGSPEAPGTPRGTPDDQSVQLEWDEPAGSSAPVDGYQVRWSSDGGATWTEVDATGSTAPAATVAGLANGTAYVFAVRAHNSVGWGAWSAASASVTPRTTPGAPTALAGTAGDARAELVWTAPASDGGDAVDDYEVAYTTDVDGDWSTFDDGTTVSPAAAVTGLANGTAYFFRVRAHNAAGWGAWSGASDAVVPLALPGAPTGVEALGGNGYASLTWTAPADTGGAPVLQYRVQAYFYGGAGSGDPVPGGAMPTDGAATSYEYALGNGRSYTFKVAARTAAGWGEWSQASQDVQLGREPDAPTALGATRGDTEVGLTWTAPSDAYGTVDGYRIRGYGAGGTPLAWSPLETGTTATSHVVTGLANGDAVYFTVEAHNATGWSAESEPSNTVTPAGLPTAPGTPAGTPGDTQVALAWTASDGNGDAVVDHDVQWSTDGGATWASFEDGTTPSPSTTVTGLVNGTSYVFRVRAANTVGYSGWSAASAAVVPRTTPGAPTALSGTPGNSEVALVWTAPGVDGGAAVSDFDVQWSADSGATWTTFADGTSTSPAAAVTGLANGTSYLFRVRAVNVAGGGAWSAESDPVVPRTVPGAPGTPTATGTDAQAAVSWAAPSDTGGSAVTSYQLDVSSDGGTTWTTATTGAATSATVTGLVNGTSYTFRVRAGNAAGQGAWSASSSSVLVAGVPSAPGRPVAVRGDTRLDVSWTAPASNNGAAVTDYTVQYSVDEGATWTTFPDTTSTATVLAVTGLTNGTSYTVRVAAVNVKGQGAWSSASDPVVPATLPGAPRTVTGTSGAAQVDLSWLAPLSDGGSAVTDYQARWSTNSGVSWTTFTDTVSAATAMTVTGLTNGTQYVFQVRAYNAVGWGGWSSTSSGVVPLAAPDAPTGLAATPGNRTIALSWTAPAYNGGAAVTDYTVQWSTDSGASWTTYSRSASTATTLTMTGLTNGTAYLVRVAAKNSVGTGPWATAAAAVTPRTTPGTPTAVVGVSGDTQVVVSWAAPASDGGSPVTDYVVERRLGTGSWDVFADGVSAATSATVTGLTNGGSYTFRVSAKNAAGQGSTSVVSAAVVPAGVPLAPTSVVGTPGDTQVPLTWTAANSNGSAVTDYEVQWSTDGATWTTFSDGTSTTAAATVTGLANGTAYYFRVRAQNAVGTGSWSAASAGVTPRTTADAPTGVSGTPGDAQVALTWAAPSSDGGAAVTDYTVQWSANSGGTWTTFADGEASTTSATVTGLVNGTPYTFRVAAVNAAGTGAWSEVSGAVTPRTVAGAPTGVSGTPGDQSLTASWTAPASDGGSAVTGYAAQLAAAADPSTWYDLPAEIITGTTLEIPTGLTNGTGYVLRVAAVNAAGQGPWSEVSAAVTPRTTADAPTGVAGTPGDQTVELTWAAPAGDGGAAVSDYTVQHSDDAGATWSTFADGTGTATSATVTGLTNGTGYVFRVAAVNAAGTGAWSEVSGAVTPRTVAGAPTGVAGTPGDQSLTASWTAPASDGGSAVTGYAAQLAAAADPSTWYDLPAEIMTGTTLEIPTGLTNGTGYVLRVAAVNAAGQGPWSAASSVVTPRTTADAPTGVSGTPGDQTVELTWTAPAGDGGAAVSDYAVQWSDDSGTTWTTFADGTGTATSATVTGLTNGTSYTFRVAAVNAAGTGAWSEVSGAVTPRTVAGAPTGVTGTPGDQTVELTWAAPAGDGGAAVTDYTVQHSDDSGTTWTTFADGASTAASATVTGLTNGTGYVFRVRAQNAAGWGAWSEVSTAVTPRTTAGAPTGVSGTPGDQSLTASWTAPASDGGSAVTGYAAQLALASDTSTWYDLPQEIMTGTTLEIPTGLTNGTGYVLRVAAVNAAGQGPWSEVSAVVTPRTTADAPTGVSGTPGDQTVALTWTAPVSDGGSAVSDYGVQHSDDSGTTWTTFADGVGTATTVTVTGLTNGTGYTFRVRAQNAAGWGPWSEVSAGVTPRTTAGAPTGVAGTPGDQSLTASWTAPASDGGSAVTGYAAQLAAAADTSTWYDLPQEIMTGTTLEIPTGLTNGTGYVLRVAAVNAAGQGPWSEVSATVTPRTVPGAPPGAGAAPGDQSAQATWGAAEANGAEVTEYQVAWSADSGATWTTWSGGTGSDTATVTGLSNGTSYLLRVRARNAAGWGAWSEAGPVVPRKVPDAPGTPSATPGDQSLTASWTAAEPNGSAVTGYAAQLAAAADTSTWYDLPQEIITGTTLEIPTGLTNGTGYVLRVAAVNAAGQGPWSEVSAAVTPRTVADAPTAVSATAYDSSAAVSWTAPASDGGAAVDDYGVQYSDDAGATWATFADGTSTATAATVTGLTNGTPYTFRVRTHNVAGWGAWSDPSPAATPYTTPGAPTSVAGTPGDQTVALTWTAPVSDGGAAVTDYTVQHSDDAGATWSTFADGTGTATSATVTGLTNGTGYTFRVAAVNGAGQGDWSSVSGAVTPRTVAGAPTGVAGTPGDQSLTASWTAPAADGGSAVTGYAAQIAAAADPSTWYDLPAEIMTGTTLEIPTGLTNGTGYVLRVAAVNAAGQGPWSAVSSVVTPRTTADAPTGVAGTPGDQTVELTWTAPVSDGGAAVSDYGVQYSDDSGTTWTTFADGTSTSTTVTVTGLTNGTGYTFRVRAQNAAGWGPWSEVSGAVTPRTTAGAPTAVVGVAGGGQAVVSWTAPGSDGGAAVTDYTVQHSDDGGSTWATFADGASTAASATVTGLTNGTGYVFRVAAVNAAGQGPWSEVSAAVTPRTVADAPTGVSGTPGDQTVELTWTAPAGDGGAAVSDYTVQFSSNGGGSWTVFADGASTATSATVTGLTNGTAYTFRVAAVNAAGAGAWSTASSAVTPYTTADAPTGVSGTPGDSSVTVSWTAPGSDGGAAVTDYTVQHSDDAGATWSTFADGTSTSTSATVTGLTNGTGYVLRVAAVNAAGQGPWSAASAGTTPRTTAGAPTGVAGVPGDQSVQVSWTAPAQDGGSAVTGYAAQIAAAADTSTWYDLPAEIMTGTTLEIPTGLTNGTGYVFRVAAVNAAGQGPWSEVSAAVTPRTVPDTPSTPSGAPGDTQAALSWAAPASDGGSAVTDYDVQYSSDSGSSWTTFADGTSTSTAATVTGLANGTGYTFRVRAVNVAGAGAWSAASAGTTPRTTPGAPTGVAGTGGDTQVALSWTAPGSDGGSAVTDYTVQWSTDGSTWTTFADGEASTTSATVTGLANGTAHTFRVAAVNAAGQGAWSAASGAVTPRTVPGAPTSVAGAAGDTQVALSWTAPSDSGGSAVTDYTVQYSSDSGSTWTTFADGEASTAASATVTGLTNGTAYTFRVAAGNAAGTGSYSTASSSVTPRTVPGATTGVTGTAGAGQVALSWTAPASDGGSAVTDYDVQYSSDSGSTWTTFTDGTAAATSATVTGLTNGTAYTFRVRAVNAAGTGAWSAASSPVTPRSTPGAPTGVAGSAGDTQVALTWTTPADDGGSAVTDYTVQWSSDSGSTWTTFADGTSTSPATSVTGLTNGTAHTFRVAAVNAAGQGAWSTATAAVTPRTTPGAPTSVAGTGGDTQVALSWTAPASDGGAAVTDYDVQYSSDSGSTWTTFTDGTSTSPATSVTGLVNGTSYTFRVRAVNAAGAGAWSAASPSVAPYTVPGAPTSVAGTGGNAQASVTWTAPASDGASAVTDYTVQYSSDSGSTWTTFADGTSTSPAASVTGLVNGTTYIFRVAAVNAAGQGAWSAASASVQLQGTPSAPGTPTATAGNAEVSLAWTAPSSGAPLLDYTVQYSSDSGSTWNTFADGTSTTAAATVTGLSGASSYTFRVAAVNAAGQGAWSDGSAAVSPWSAPTAPTSPAATADGPGQLTFTWTAATSAGTALTGHTVEVKDMSDSSVVSVATGSAASTYTRTGLVVGRQYQFRVAATNAVGTGPFSSWSSSTTVITTPGAPTAVTSTSADSSVSLTWAAPGSDGGGAVTDYQVTVTDGSGGAATGVTGATTRTVGSATASYTFTGLTNGTSYKFTVAAVNAAGAGAASAGQTHTNPALVNGVAAYTQGFVKTMVQVGNILYIGGSFTEVKGEPRTNAAAIDTSTGTVLSWRPNPNNAVNRLAVDNGVVYLVGTFTGLRPYGTSDIVRNRAAAVVDAATWANTAADVKAWNPNLGAAANDVVVQNNFVHLVGAFTTVNPSSTGSVTRNYAAAVKVSANWAGTAADLSSWNPTLSAAGNDLEPSGSTRLWVGGNFATVNPSGTGSQARTGLVLLDDANNWNAAAADVASLAPGAGSAVNAITVSGGYLYAVGGFTTACSSGSGTCPARNRTAAWDATTGALTGWTVSFLNPNDVAVWDNKVYLAGYSGTATPYRNASATAAGTAGTAVSRNGFLVARDVANWDNTNADNNIYPVDPQLRITNPSSGNGVLMVEQVGSHMHLGGYFTGYKDSGGALQGSMGWMRLDSSGTATAGPYKATTPVTSLATSYNTWVSGDYVYVSGSFVMLGDSPRGGAAAFNASTGALAEWDPNMATSSPDIRSISVADGVAYVVGSSVGGVSPSSSYTTSAAPSRSYAFAVSSAENWTGTTADLKGWNPRPSALVSRVWASGGSVYLSGNFTTLNPSGAATVARNFLAAVDTSANWSSVTADVQSWYPQPSGAGTVSELAVGASGVYLAGTFTTVNPGGTGAVARNYAAAVALPGAWAGTAADLLSWNPNLNASASTVAVDGTTVYLGGTFTTVGGTARNRAAALSTSGTLQTWDPSVTATVNYLQVLSDKVYLSTEAGSLGDYSPKSSTNGSVFVKKAADWSAGSTSNVLAYRGPYGRFSRVASSGRVVGNTSSSGVAVLVYAVTAVDEAVPMAAPGAPTGLSVVAGPTQVTLSWTAPSANGSVVTGYTVTPYNSSGGSVAVASQTVTLLGRTTQVFTGLTAATGYTFKVTATNAYGTSAASSLSSVATTP